MSASHPSGPPTPEELIRLLTVALRNRAMYTSEHPAFLKSMKQFTEALQLKLQERERFSLQAARDQVLVDQRVLPSNPLLRGFAGDLLQRGVQGITISHGVTPRELGTLIEILARKAKGADVTPLPLEEELRARGVVRIWVHTLRVNLAETPGSLSATLLDRWLQGQRPGTEGRDALTDLLLRDPDELIRLVSRPPDVREAGEGKAHPASERLIALMEHLLGGHPEEWTRFEERLAQLLLGLDLQTQLDFFFRAFDRKGEPAHWAQRLAGSLPTPALADLVSQAAISPWATNEKADFIRGLAPDAAKRRELLPELERKLAEYGVPKEEFLRLLGEDGASLDQRLSALLQGPSITVEDMDDAVPLVQGLLGEERREDALRVINRVFNALNHPEWEIRKAVASRMPPLLEVTDRFQGGHETSRKAREFALRKMLVEPDEDVFRIMSEALEGVARDLFKRDEPRAALELLDRIHASLGASQLGPEYLTGRREATQAYLLENKIVDQAVRDLAVGSETEIQQALVCTRLAGEEGVRKLIHTLGDESQMGRRLRLIRALTDLGDLAVEPLRRSLLDPRWYLVRNAVKVLAEIGDPRAIPSLLGLLTHSEARVRREVVQALGASPSSKAQEGVIKALEDSDEGVRLRAVEALQATGGVIAREKIRLIAFRSTARDASMRIRAIKALGTVGQEEEIPALEALLSRKGLFSKTESDEVRRSAVLALGGILERTGSPKARQALQGAVQSDPAPELRKLAEEAMASSGGPPTPGPTP